MTRANLMNTGLTILIIFGSLKLMFWLPYKQTEPPYKQTEPGEMYSLCFGHVINSLVIPMLRCPIGGEPHLNFLMIKYQYFDTFQLYNYILFFSHSHIQLRSFQFFPYIFPAPCRSFSFIKELITVYYPSFFTFAFSLYSFQRWCTSFSLPATLPTSFSPFLWNHI